MNRAKALVSLTTIMVMVALLTGVSAALFTSEAKIADNFLSAGKLEIAVLDGEKTLAFQANNMKPGDLLEKTIELENSGTLPFVFRVDFEETGASPDGSGQGYLPRALDLELSTAGDIFYSGTFEEMLHSTGSFEPVIINGEPLILEPGESAALDFKLSFDLSAGNEYQESTWQGAIIFEAVQSEHSEWSAGTGTGSETELPEIPLWQKGARYEAGDRVLHKGDVYECQLGHTASVDNGELIAPIREPGHDGQDKTDFWHKEVPGEEGAGSQEQQNLATNPDRFSASRTDSGAAANLAESDSPESFWQIGKGGTAMSEYLQYEFAEDTAISGYALVSTNAGNRAPNSWVLKGSSDGETWDSLDSQAGITFGSYDQQTYFLPEVNQSGYRYYRLHILESSQEDRTALSMIRLFQLN